jgi:peptidoglycan/LPS O-acetylase OafA/YrhL
VAEISSQARAYPVERDLPVPPPAHAKAIRSDIQGLRAIAVLAVVLFHIWPGLIPGGFVGVDVYFVISGYLITGILFRELQQTGRIALSRFYVRRMKRLLPAAGLVLIVVTVLMTPLLPPSRWEETAIEILASAFYLENWRLAWSAVDYLSAGNPASPVQHFWSLSIEEQFYIFWPLIMIAAGVVIGRFSKLRTAIALPLLLIVAMSFGASVWLTETSREAAYFVTHSRLWQLGIGALLAIAVLPVFSPGVREAMRAAGLAAIVLSALAFSGGMSFPGYAALLPTLGCALVLAAGVDNDSSLSRLLALPPVQYLGDVSYSVYLWHWPIVVFAGAYAPGGMSLPFGLTLLTATLVISHLSKRFVEDPIRYAEIDTGKWLAYAGGVIVCCVLGALGIYHQFAVHALKLHIDEVNFPGARAYLAGAAVPAVEAAVPPLIMLKKDKAEVYKENCHVGYGAVDPTPCRYGPEDGAKIVLVGDSHAASWAPALIAQADAMGWRLETHTKSACALFKEMLKRASGPYLDCRLWGEKVLDRLRASPPDLVIVSQGQFHEVASADGPSSRRRTAAAIVDLWRELRALGIKVVAIRDTPHLPFEPGECVARDPNCYAEQSVVLRDDDPILIAHQLMPEVAVIDMTDAFCQNARCPVVIGNVVAWRDSSHPTASYARTMATVLADRIVAATGGR